jgi:hypothetical protein
MNATAPRRFERAALALGMLACVVLVGACGSSHKATTSTTTTKAVPPPKPAVITETAALIADQQAASAVLKAAPGSPVVFRTVYPPSFAGSSEQVGVHIVRATATKWSVAVTANGQHATATVESSTGKPIALVNLAYTCAAPPAPSVCPARDVHATATQTKLQFTAPADAPVAITGDVGPIASTSVPKPTTSQVVPTYRLHEVVSAVSPGAKVRPSGVSPGTVASVKPGDFVSMVTILIGRIVGALQPVTVKFSQGPATAITISASTPGGPASNSTLKSADGSPIELLLPTYRCYLPPRASPCPAERIHAGGKRYAFTFAAGPQAPILLAGKIQAG